MKSVVLQRFLPLLLVVSLGLPVVQAYSKKTFLMPRAVGMNKAMEFTPWDSNLYEISLENHCIHSRVQVIPFYQASTNKSDVGEYFGIGNGKNSFTVGARYNFDLNNPVTGPLLTNATEVDGALLSGNFFANQFFVGTVNFNPDQEVWGARVDVEYFNHPQSGFYLNAAMPFASVSNSMNMCIDGDKAIQIAVASNGTTPTGPFFTLSDFFAGKVSINAATDPTDRRDPLTKSKIAGKQTRGGLADLDLTLGYRHNCCGERRFAGNVRLTVPTGNRVKGCYLFEPVCGNGQHMGLGAGIDAGFQMWRHNTCQIWIDGGLQYKYLFEQREVRMLGVKGFSVVPPLANYCLMSTVHGITADGVALFPAANQLTREVNVTPGSHLDGLLDLSFQTRNFVFDLGYNVYWRTSESVKIRSWDDNTYGILTTAILTSDGVTTGGGATPFFLDGNFVNRGNLDTCAATTPSQFSQKIHAGFLYRTDYCCCPVALGIGGSYEFASDNSALDQYAVWLKGSFDW